MHKVSLKSVSEVSMPTTQCYRLQHEINEVLGYWMEINIKVGLTVDNRVLAYFNNPVTLNITFNWF